jgi:DNA-binding protein H-NS
MDKLGQVFKDLERAAREREVREATSLAEVLREDGMTNEQIEEMLCSDGFDHEVVVAAMSTLPQKRAKRDPRKSS